MADSTEAPESIMESFLSKFAFYKHSRLNYSLAHIRLLHLDDPDTWPFTETPEKTIFPSGRLVTYDLERCDDVPPYTAISYEWGLDQPTYPAIIDGHRLELRENLHKFLVRLAGHDRKYCPTLRKWSEGYWTRKLWIDQICIDQSYTTERDHQVKMMGKIFNDADEVVAWLGDEPPKGGYNFRPTAWVASDVRDYSGQLFCCTFWDRLWCQQEIALARKLTFMRHMEESPTQPSGQSDVKFWVSFGKDIPDCLRLFEEKKKDAQLPDLKLERAIRLFARRESSDARDRIYGLQGMVKLEERIPVDYELEDQDVFYAALDKVLECENTTTWTEFSDHETTFDLLAQDMKLEEKVRRTLPNYISKHRKTSGANAATERMSGLYERNVSDTPPQRGRIVEIPPIQDLRPRQSSRSQSRTERPDDMSDGSV